MANKNILIKIQVNDKASPEIKNTGNAVDGLAKSVKLLTIAEQKEFIISEKARIKKTAQINMLKQQAAAQLQVAAANNANKASAGLNNAILLETGRLASDVSYGFQGIANNLGQIISLFQIGAKNAGGFKAQLLDLKNQFFGVGGLLIGVQLLISFLPQIQKWFQKSAKAALGFSGAFDELASKVGNSAGNFEIYIKTLQSSTKSEKEKKDAIESLNKEFPEYISSLEKANISLDDVKNKTDDATLANDDYRKSIIKLAMSQAAQAKIQEISAEVVEKLKVRQIELQKLGLTEESLARDRSQSIGGEFLLDEKRKRDAAISRLQAETEEHKKFLADKEKEIDVLLGFVDIQVKSTKTLTELKKAFVAGELNFDKEIEKSAARVSKSLQENKDKQIQIEADSVIELARIRQQDFADRQQKRVDAIKNDEDRAKAQIKINIEIAESEASLNTYIEQIQKEAERKKNARNLADQEKAYAQLEKLQGIELESRLKFNIAMEDMDLNRIEKQRDLNELATKNKIDLLNRELSHAESVGNSTIAIQEKINNVNAASNRASIKLDEIEFETKKEHLMDLGSAIVEFAGESSTAGKAVSIAMAIVNTEEAITEALTLPYPFNFVAAATVGLRGASSIRKILSTKIPGKEPSNSGASGGETVNAPDFNVVGTSETSQLAQAVGQTSQSQVVKAYVVGSEITSQQEFDRTKELTSPQDYENYRIIN